MTRKASSRYDLSGGVETRTQPGSGRRVLRNKLGITLKRDMDRAEFDALLHAQEQWLGLVTTETRFTAKLICRMHADWLGEIYEWVGQYRSVDLTKGDFTWPPAMRVAENMTAFENGLLAERTPCRPGGLPDVARAIAEVHAELLLIHPFREGNGRLARWLADLMAAQAGLPMPQVQFAGIGSRGERVRYLAAVKAGYLQRYADLTAFFAETLERRMREAGSVSGRGSP